jgi:hypothetical protein
LPNFQKALSCKPQIPNFEQPTEQLGKQLDAKIQRAI